MNARALASSILILTLAGASVVACGGPKAPDTASTKRAGGACGKLGDGDCAKVMGMLSAMDSFSNVNQELILDARSTFSPGRGMERVSAGAWRPTTAQCAQPREAGKPIAAPTKIDPTAIDFSFIGVAIDEAVVGAHVPVSQVVAVGGEARLYTVRLLAVAFARDLDPQFFGPSDLVAYKENACACDRATHFIGAVKYGGMLSYETTVKGIDLQVGTVLDVVKAKLFAEDTDIRQVSTGGLEVTGLEEQIRGGPRTKPLDFKVKNPVPIAYAVYPVSDVCKFSLPLPDVAPNALDFGLVPNEKKGSRLLHVTNRAPFDLVAYAQGASYAVPALGSLDVPVEWKPSPSTSACDEELREETVVFSPRDEATPVTPKQHSVKLSLRARGGAGAIERSEHIDSGVARRPDYESTSRDLACPSGYVVDACTAEHADCSDGKCGPGYLLEARQTDKGCHFACRGPRAGVVFSEYCRFDGKMACRLKCE